MDYLHSAVEIGAGQVVHVTLRGHAANVMLLDDAGFTAYQAGSAYRHQAGGHFQHSPVVLRPPHVGRWHLVVDLGGAQGQVNACITIRPG
jgi:hypothetical protein